MKEKRINHRGHRGKINSLCSQRHPLAESRTKCRGSVVKVVDRYE